VKKGGTLNIVRHAVEMRVPAEEIPDALVADLANLEIAESMHISAVPLPESCKLIETDRDFTIATIVPPVVVKEEAVVATGKGAKGKGKK
jgi:large subunit ribosomal protein L25